MRQREKLLAQSLSPVRQGQIERTHRSSSISETAAFFRINMQAHRGSGKLANLGPSCPGSSTEPLGLLYLLTCDLLLSC